jgi:hypothetical protein
MIFYGKTPRTDLFKERNLAFESFFEEDGLGDERVGGV